MEILARFFVIFGSAFLSIGVVMFSFLRRTMYLSSKKKKQSKDKDKDKDKKKK
jgi:hypothetical protein